MLAFSKGLELISCNLGQKKKVTWMTIACFLSWSNLVAFNPKFCCILTKKLEKLMDLQGLIRGENLLMNGPADLGKSLPTVVLEKRAILAGYCTVFIEEKPMNEWLLEKNNDLAKVQHFVN